MIVDIVATSLHVGCVYSLPAFCRTHVFDALFFPSCCAAALPLSSSLSLPPPWPCLHLVLLSIMLARHLFHGPAVSNSVCRVVMGDLAWDRLWILSLCHCFINILCFFLRFWCMFVHSTVAAPLCKTKHWVCRLDAVASVPIFQPKVRGQTMTYHIDLMKPLGIAISQP